MTFYGKPNLLGRDLKNIKIALRHGRTGTGEHNSWSGMKARCYNQNNRQYNLYGGRGIRVCERWLTSFENFFEDMGLKPTLKHSLDRYPDRDGNYEPGNCRWATSYEQAQNLKSTKLLNYNGKVQSQAAWARELGIHPVTLRERLKKWSLEKALSTQKIFK